MGWRGRPARPIDHLWIRSRCLRTNRDATNFCTLAPGAPLGTQADGDGGIDNSAGANLLFQVEVLEGDTLPSATETVVMRAGAWTLELQLDGFTSATNVDGIGARVFTCGAFDQGTPTFDTTTDWPVFASSVNDGASVASGAREQFDNHTSPPMAPS